MNYFLIDGRYDDLLRHYGLDPQAVLRQAELLADTLNHDRITMKEEQYYRFMQVIDELKTMDDLAVKMATADQIETFSPPIFAAYCSHNGEQCINRLAEYKKLIGPMTYQITSSADQVTVELLPGDASLKIPAFLAVAEWAFLIGLLRRATKQEVTPVKVVLNAAKPDPALAELAGIKLESGSINQISFSKADLQWPFVSYNAAMWNYFEPELTKHGGYSCTKGVLEKHPTAVFAANDEMAIGLYRGLAENGVSVPDDISVVGFDDIDLAEYVTPKLTTIQQPIREIGEQATKMLFNRIQNPDTAIQTSYFGVKLVVRDSTKQA